MNLLENVRCSTSNCEGSIIVLDEKVKGLGGSKMLNLGCSICEWKLDFNSSHKMEKSKRSVITTTILLSFLLSGATYSDYEKIFGSLVGESKTSDTTWYSFLEYLHPIVKQLLDEQCEFVKNYMKSLPDSQLGSWKRAVTTSDGCWQIRGHHSPNSTFVLANFLEPAIIYYENMSQRANTNDENKGDLGTSKSAEGRMADKIFQQCVDEGCFIETNFQDQDSNAYNTLTKYFPDAAYHCSGHVNRSFGNQLEKYSQIKNSDKNELDGLTCHCRRHKKNCGCITKPFVTSAKINHFCIIKNAGKDPLKYQEGMENFGKYHSKDIHTWEGGQCDFHPLVVCCCEKRCESGNLSCKGKAYTVKFPLTCPFHSKCFELECIERGEQAFEIIHPELGKGHSNIPESIFSILVHFRDKNTSLRRLAYELYTMFGLLQFNQTFMTKYVKRNYSWQSTIFERCGLTPPPAVNRFFEKKSAMREKIKEKYQSPEAKKLKTQRKIEKRKENEKRKEHTAKVSSEPLYGLDFSIFDEEEQEEIKVQEESQVDLGEKKVSDENNCESDESDIEENSESGSECNSDIDSDGSEDNGDQDDSKEDSKDDSKDNSKDNPKDSSKKLVVVFDLEASSYIYTQADITQIASECLILSNGEVQSIEGKFSSFVKTSARISRTVQILTGIFPLRNPRSPLRNSPIFQDVINNWFQWIASKLQQEQCSEVILMGHNIRGFDLRLLFHEGSRKKVNILQKMKDAKIFTYIDSLRAIRSCKKGFQWPHQLLKTEKGKDSLAQRSIYAALFGQSQPNSHRADADVENLTKVICHPILMPLLFKTTPERIGSLILDMKNGAKKKQKKQTPTSSKPSKSSGTSKSSKHPTTPTSSGTSIPASTSPQPEKKKRTSIRCEECGAYRHGKNSKCEKKKQKEEGKKKEDGQKTNQNNLKSASNDIIILDDQSQTEIQYFFFHLLFFFFSSSSSSFFFFFFFFFFVLFD